MKSFFSICCLCTIETTELHPLIAYLFKKIGFMIIKLKTKFENPDIWETGFSKKSEITMHV